MRTISPEQLEAIIDKVMTENAELMRRLAAFEAVSHLPQFERVRPPARDVPDTAAHSNFETSHEDQ